MPDRFISDMDVFEAVRTLLAVRQYADRPVPDQVVRRIVDAAHLSASASNRQAWHFVVIQDRAMLQRLGSLARTGPYVAGAPLAVVVAAEPTPYGLSDASRAIQDMMLVGWESGVGSNWVGFAGALDAVATELGIPSGLQVVAIVPFGYPVRELGRGKKQRKPLGEVVSRERYGQPFD